MSYATSNESKFSNVRHNCSPTCLSCSELANDTFVHDSTMPRIVHWSHILARFLIDNSSCSKAARDIGIFNGNTKQIKGLALFAFYLLSLYSFFKTERYALKLHLHDITINNGSSVSHSYWYG
ncbi:MAG: hypothetical protein WCA39_03160 [Nitrososphaeraceae archaeon]